MGVSHWAILAYSTVLPCQCYVKPRSLRRSSPGVLRSLPYERREMMASAAMVLPSLLALTPPSQAMWQQWQPDDMLYYVSKYAVPLNATSVLAAMDRAAETSWMMNMGPEKSTIVQEIISDLQPKRVLEIGTFLGYMTISMALALPEGSSLVTIEKDTSNHNAAVTILKTAFGDDLSAKAVPVEPWLGSSGSVLESREFQKRHGRQPFDLVLMDHWKPEYAVDLRRLESLGLIRTGTVVLADNVLFPGAPELLEYLGVPNAPAEDSASGQECLAAPEAMVPGSSFQAQGWRTSLIPVPFEYRPLTPDAISYSKKV